MAMRQLRISNSITNRESQSLEKYLQEISRVEMVSPDVEADLAARIQKGDKQALDQLTRANLRFVVSVAKQYQGQGLSLSDLINEGNLGLIKAAERFDHSKGFKFISFAVWWIRQNILQALAENSRMIRIPLNKVALNKRIYNTQIRLEQELERSPTETELAEALELDLSEVSNSLKQHNRHLSLDTPLGEDEESNLIDVIENPNAESSDRNLYHSDSLRLELTRCFKNLTPRQKQTLCYFFGIGVEYPMTLEDIAQKFDLTTERVRQIKDKALERLRKMQNFDSLRGFLGH